MNDATQQGATVQERLEAFLSADEAPEQPQGLMDEPEEQHDAVDEVADEAEDVETEEQPELEDEGEDPADAEEDVESSVELSAIAEYLGVDEDKLDVDEDGKVILRTKIDGEEGRAKLSDLLKSYQLEGHLNKQNMEVAEQRKALEQKMAEAEQQASARLQQLEDLSNAAYQELVREYQSIDWNELRRVDPGEYAAKQTEYNQRLNTIQQGLQRAQMERQQQSYAQQERLKHVLSEESQKLVRAIPEWQDEAVAKKERGEIREYLTGKLGFSDEDVNQVYDHRQVQLIRKAMLYDKLQGTKAEVTKKVKKAPKLAKPGQTTDAQSRKVESLKKLKTTVKKSGGKGQALRDYLIKTGKV